ncbi:MAG TPA: aspartate aminotransferase [Opitutae bacterium]|nr:aspartate aminotransferase [Opitutaceae bacterium]HCR31124.1 aspartate aminotransferase [Opitutae bacterium]
MKLAQRISNLQHEGAYRVMSLAQSLEREGKDIVHLEIGQPDFKTFPEISEAGKRAIDEGYTRYNPSEGYGDLRESIAEFSKQRGIHSQPSQIVVGPGAKPVLLFPLMALLEEGDEALYPDPGFPSYRADIEIAGGTPVPVPLVEANSFSFDLEALEARITERTKILILNSPANPTGGVISKPDLEAIAALAQEHKFYVLSDEIYSRLVYDDSPAESIYTIDGMPERTIIVDGFSKSYAMTGWRLGYAIMPKALAAKVSLLLTHAVGCTAGFTQRAGIVALLECDDDVSKVVQQYQKRRDAFVAGLNSVDGIRCRLPEGAFYAFPNVSAIGIPSTTLADRLLNEAGVACLSGTDFGPNGEGYLRFTYAASQAELDEAVRRVGEFVAGL